MNFIFVILMPSLTTAKISKTMLTTVCCSSSSRVTPLWTAKTLHVIWSHGQHYLPSSPGRLDDVMVGLGGLVERIPGTDDRTQPTSFHPCVEQRCTLLVLLLREEDRKRLYQDSRLHVRKLFVVHYWCLRCDHCEYWQCLHYVQFTQFSFQLHTVTVHQMTPCVSQNVCRLFNTAWYRRSKEKGHSHDAALLSHGVSGVDLYRASGANDLKGRWRKMKDTEM